MAVITLLSSHDAPGVTTTSIGVALNWPRRVLLVEADPSGTSILFGYRLGVDNPNRTIVGAAFAYRDGRLEDLLTHYTQELDPKTPTVRLLAGMPSFEQAVNLGPVWPALADVFGRMHNLGMDVIVDAGRLGSQHFAMPLVAASDVCVMVLHPTMRGIAKSRHQSVALQRHLERVGAADTFGLVLVEPARGVPTYSGEVAEQLNAPVLASIPHDVAAASVYSDGTAAREGRRAGRSPLPAAYATLAERLVARINEQRLGRQPA